MKRNLLKFTYYWVEVGYPDRARKQCQSDLSQMGLDIRYHKLRLRISRISRISR